jgi:hypothetical protein
MDPVIIAFALLLGTVLISRLLLIKGLGLLNSSEQGKVTVMFSKHRIWNLVVNARVCCSYIIYANHFPIRQLFNARLYLPWNYYGCTILKFG